MLFTTKRVRAPRFSESTGRSAQNPGPKHEEREKNEFFLFFTFLAENPQVYSFPIPAESFDESHDRVKSTPIALSKALSSHLKNGD
jgi:hypothetical protein